MDTELEPALDISEFKCTAIDPAGVVVVFAQTNRRYVYPRRDGELCLTTPGIEGGCDPHPPEIIDCLARAVAFHAVQHAAVRPAARSRMRIFLRG